MASSRFEYLSYLEINFLMTVSIIQSRGVKKQRPSLFHSIIVSPPSVLEFLFHTETQSELISFPKFQEASGKYLQKKKKRVFKLYIKKITTHTLGTTCYSQQSLKIFCLFVYFIFSYTKYVILSKEIVGVPQWLRWLRIWCLSLPWLWSDPWLGNYGMLQAGQKKREKSLNIKRILIS